MSANAKLASVIPGGAISRALLVATVVAAVYAGASGRILSPLLLVLVCCAALVALAAFRAATQVVQASWLLVLAIPIYWVPSLPFIGLGATPGIVLPLLLLPAAVARAHGFRLNIVDVCFLIFVSLRAIGFVVNQSDPRFSLLQLLLMVAAPYAAMRCLMTSLDRLRRVSRTIVLTMSALALVGLFEWTGSPNPFFNVEGGGHQAITWARPELRFGETRAEASFGHPIAFGLTLVLAVLLALALAWEGKSTTARLAWYSCAGVMACGILATLSRGPTSALVVGVLLMLVGRGRRLRLTHVLGVSALASAIFLLTPASTIVQELADSLTGTSDEAASAEYRLDLARMFTDSSHYTPFGQPVAGDSADLVASVSQRTGLQSIDNEFLLLFLQTGWLPFAAFIALALATFRASFRTRRGSALGLAWTLGGSLTFPLLGSVALLTQHTTVFWASLGIASALLQMTPARQQSLGPVPGSMASERPRRRTDDSTRLEAG